MASTLPPGRSRVGPSSDRVVMVVDDQPLNQRFLRLALHAEGFATVCARDADEIRASLGRRRPWLIMMDIQLPGADGLALTRAIKDDPSTRDILIIAFTSYGLPADGEQLRAAGCDGYLTKPVDLHHLQAVIRRLRAAPGQQTTAQAPPEPGRP